jgi:hypothetical protein
LLENWQKGIRIIRIWKMQYHFLKDWNKLDFFMRFF